MFKNGDWRRPIVRACRKVSSNTASPVVLVKSAMTIVSLSVSFADRWERQYKPPAAKSTNTVAAERMLFQGTLSGAAVTASWFTAESAPGLPLDVFDKPVPAAVCPEEDAAAPDRPESVSRFSRC